MSTSSIEIQGLRALAHLGATLIEARDLHQATEWVTTALRDAWDWDHTVVWYRNRPTQSFWVYQSDGRLAREFEETMEYTFTSAHIDHIARVAQANTIEVISTANGPVFAHEHTASLLANVTTIVVVPIKYSDRSIGVVEFFITDASIPSPVQLDHITKAFNYLSIFVQQRQTLNRASLLGRIAKASKDLTANIEGGTSPKEMIGRSAQSFIESFDYLHTIAWQREGDSITMCCQHGLLGECFEGISSPPDYEYPNERLLDAMATGTTHIDNHPDDREWVHHLGLQENGVISIIVLPIVVQGQTVGAIECFLPYHVNQWDEEYVNAYTGLANIISLAIQRF